MGHVHGPKLFLRRVGGSSLRQQNFRRLLWILGPPGCRSAILPARPGRGKLAAESARLFKVPAGDNAAEGVLGNLKATLRRSGGAGKKRSDSKRSIDALAASSLLRQPGVEAIKDAHVEYRKAALSGHLGLSPSVSAI